MNIDAALKTRISTRALAITLLAVGAVGCTTPGDLMNRQCDGEWKGGEVGERYLGEKTVRRFGKRATEMEYEVFLVRKPKCVATSSDETGRTYPLGMTREIARKRGYLSPGGIQKKREESLFRIYGVKPGVGVGDIRIGVSKGEDVLRAYGGRPRVTRDAKGAILWVDYSGNSQRLASRGLSFSFHRKTGVLTSIRFSGATLFRLPGGITGNSSPEDVVRAFGRPDKTEPRKGYEVWRYREGVQFYVYRNSKTGRERISFSVIESFD